MNDLPIGRGRMSEGHRREAKRFKIITDGLKTEEGYFVRLNELSFDTVETVTKKGFSLDEMLEEAKKIKAFGADYDEVCIVLDIDDRLKSRRSKRNLVSFLGDAENAGVPVYLSNESFEVWLLAHKMIVPKRAWKREEATKLAISSGLLDGERHKNVVFEEINSNNVRRALIENDRLRKAYGNNLLKSKPMTDVDKIVGKIELLD